jgi:pimeloyl-ACP methyl ester carboxylesterase
VLLRINGLDTYVSVEGSGHPILLLHGWASSSQSFAGLMAALADTFRVVAVDLPGFGWSRRPPEAWGAADYAAHLERVAETMALGTPAVLGHSFGGHIAIHLAARQPGWVSRLVLVASAGIRPRRRFHVRLRQAGARLVKRFFSLPGWGATGRGIIERVSHRLGSRDFRAAGPMRPTLVKVVNEDVSSLLAAIHAPTLILWGDRDREVPRAAMEIMAEGIAGSRLVVLDGAGHFPFLDMPEDFTRRLKGFLNEGA